MGRKALIVIADLIFLIFISSFTFFVKACSFDYTYYSCTGTCPAGYTCENTAPETCTCVSNNPAPSPTSVGGASPTGLKPTLTPAGYNCSNPPPGCYSTQYCMYLSCGCLQNPACKTTPGPDPTCQPGCSSICGANGHCYVTQPSPHTLDYQTPHYQTIRLSHYQTPHYQTIQ